MFAKWVHCLGYLDLTTQGQPSFSKFVCLALLIAALVGIDIPLGVQIALLSASFGRSMWLAFLNRTTVATVESRAINSRRDHTEGFEPTP